MVPNVVDVQISLKTASITKKAFGVPLIVGTTKAANLSWPRATVYTNTDAMLSDGFAVSSPEYLAAAAVFKQTPRPQSVIIGQSKTADASISETLSAINAANSGFYFVILCDRTPASVVGASDWCQDTSHGTHIFLTASSDANIINQSGTSDPIVDTTSIWYLTRANSRTKIIAYAGAGYSTTYNPNDPVNVQAWASKYIEAAYAAVAAVMTIGSYTMKFKTLEGITPDVYTDTQKANAWGKRVDTYSTVGGADITENGTTNTEWFDVMVGRDWLQARMEERVFKSFLDNPKIAYTDAGVGILAGDVDAALNEGVRTGLIAPVSFDSRKNQKGGYIVNTLPVAEVSADVKATRSYNFITFTAWLAGAIHDTVIQGTLTY